MKSDWSMAVPRHPGEDRSNALREELSRQEPKSQRTFTPSLAVIAKSEGAFLWTPEGRRLFDFTSGVLVANLGHNPPEWWERLREYLAGGVPLTAYNAATLAEVAANRRLLEFVQSRAGGRRLEQVLWAASGSEAIHKSLAAALAFRRPRDVVLATRHGFHGKKGLANAVTGSESDPDRDPRVRFISFPMAECRDVAQRNEPFDPAPYRRELELLWSQDRDQVAALITEPYLGGGGSFHPPAAYLRLLQDFCREHDIVFILDEVQSNFGRTAKLFAFETYGLEPDLVVLGKSLANGVPVAAVVGRGDILASQGYGEASDTWSANPLSCAAVLATLDGYADVNLLPRRTVASRVVESGLLRLKRLPFIAAVRGEADGMVWGVETRDCDGLSASEWANAIVERCYRGDGATGLHLLGPLAQCVIRIAPPLVLTSEQAADALELLHRILVERMNGR
jgi:4-aminobutyrate aminotransferase-like enzyme